jgi:serine/threonine protein kinase
MKRFMILRTIGQGGMGAVYKAQDLKRRTVCAIKEMSLSMVPPEDREKAVHNFKTEAQMLSSLKHPNLPSVAGYFAEGMRHFLVMEYIEGLTLDEYLLRNDAPFSEGRVLGWARQLCNVLTYLHSQQPPIIFRDMKPGNIMLMRDGRVKLIDFGIARFFRYMGAQDTQLLGTPGYAPPEQYGKAQTDKRSDIYSLAMTLFQLMTNTLSEKGFGLNDVHTLYPFISLHVARALEKATSLAPEDRFQSAEDFRRALFSENTFMFENGEQALTAEELAGLSARFSDEAADYLFSGEIEDWLRKTGNAKLARVTRDIRNQHLDPYEAVDLFLQAVLGPNVHILTSSGKQSIVTKSSRTGIPVVPPLNQTDEYRNNQDWTSRRPVPATGVPAIVVQPRTLDFGEVYAGLSEPLLLAISDKSGTHGTISTSEPWIQLDETSFDGINTHLNVRVNTLRLRGPMHYTGTIVVMPDEEDEEQDIVVKVEVDVLGNIGMYPDPAMNGQGGGEAPGATVLDEDDYEAPIAFANGKTITMDPQQASAPTLSPKNMAHYEEYKAKYGDPFDENEDNTAASGWHTSQASPRHQLWLQRILTVFAAFMLASLFYTLLSKIASLPLQLLLPPDSWFIGVLSGIGPAATLGALMLNWNRTWSFSDTINRLCTGISTAFAAISICELVWQFLFHMNAPTPQLFVMLLVAAFGSVFGISMQVSDRIIYSVHRALQSARWLVMVALIMLGGILGFFLTVGFALDFFTFVGILAGGAVATALVTRVDQI